MLRRMVVLLQFVLLGIGTFYQDLWEFGQLLTFKIKVFKEIFSYSEKGLEFLTFDDIVYIFIYSF